MKAIMLSIRPKWCAKIMNGDKTIEIRKGTALYKAIKKLIEQYGYADIYVYCTKDTKNGLYWAKKWVCVNQTNCVPSIRNGKVIFKFRCYMVEKLFGIECCDGNEFAYITKPYNNGEILKKTCLKHQELNEYLNYKDGYAIHISDLEIFDRPKELSEFRKHCHYHWCCDCPKWEDDKYGKPLNCDIVTKAPQSWCYVEVE